MRYRIQFIKSVGIILFTCQILTACQLLPRQKPGIGESITWVEVPGWNTDQHAESWPALLNSCQARQETKQWKSLCKEAIQLDTPSHLDARLFYEKWFLPHIVNGKSKDKKGLITGYYEPLLKGNLTATDRYRYPLYQRPSSLLTIDLGDMYPELAGKRVRGRVEGQRVIPFYSREEIETSINPLSGEELIWVDSYIDAFFLHIQGSGRVQLPNGEIVGIGYADQNGHPYVAIGRTLLRNEALTREEISLFTIREWLETHPNEATEVLNSNPSYVFFQLNKDQNQGAVGSLNVPLTAERSIAIDPSVIDLGLPIWLMTNIPGEPESRYERLVFAQDTGGAIKGALRADLFWGFGDRAENMAGIMKESGQLIVLLPRTH